MAGPCGNLSVGYFRQSREGHPGPERARAQGSAQLPLNGTRRGFQAGKTGAEPDHQTPDGQSQREPSQDASATKGRFVARAAGGIQ